MILLYQLQFLLSNCSNFVQQQFQKCALRKTHFPCIYIHSDLSQIMIAKTFYIALERLIGLEPNIEESTQNVYIFSRWICQSSNYNIIIYTINHFINKLLILRLCHLQTSEQVGKNWKDRLAINLLSRENN